ncbi:PTS system mannose/fructose/sorbose family transporter subunit IID [Lactococcus lactis]|uniref:PTS system mannose/fructose/sorbose family transporter subunit IID n=1 Tax=Lactococcus lactis TaxID=1358 RepID=A0A9X4S3Q7_9LACT|nr:PTS system mannose/fructose/sorbose family transporter subunit IID [Lactococcus lactis]MCT0056401.1 PTS mannose/fructose/sorbose transporter family subunit IID [Lactococcus lactis subsp. lactis]MDG4982387.1 PTS system mannose/fructose/sorbose family transporter subunit IID [Lactococcus lactis]
MTEKTKLTKKDRLKVNVRSWWLLGSFNYERMQNIGIAFSLIPAIKKLYTKKEDQAEALKRHLEFFNTHPYVAAPILGVTMALEEERASGSSVVDDTAIQGTKIGMMGPLAGIGDPLFWFTLRPIIGAIAASLAVSGSLVAPIFFILVWNMIRIAFMWYTQELGYKQGVQITKNVTLLSTITRGAGLLGMFIMGVLIERWVSINFITQVSKVKLQKGAYIDFNSFHGNIHSSDIQTILQQYAGGYSLSNVQVTTLQENLDKLLPGLAGVLLTFLCMWLLRKKVSPVLLILGIFVVGILAHVIGIL